MKKILLVLALILVLLGANRTLIRADYILNALPGGKNYLSADNFTADGFNIVSLDNIMVIPNSYYTLTVDGTFADTLSSVAIHWFENGDSIGMITKMTGDFVACTAYPDRRSLTFLVPPEVNYLMLEFVDVTNEYEPPFIGTFQMELGLEYTGYEAYIHGTIVDTQGPEIDGQAVVISDVSNPVTSNDILASLSAYDAIDGDLSASITIGEDQYAGRETLLGEYEIIFVVTDSQTNSTTFSVIVKVVDITAPYFADLGEIDIPFGQAKTVDELKVLLSVSDNYDQDIPLTSIEILSEDYFGNEAIVGTYSILFQATDESGNVSTHELFVHVVDAVFPLITGPSTMSIGYNHKTLIASLLAAYSVTDNYDGDLTTSLYVLTDTYSSHHNQIGDYLVVFRVVDSSGNASEKTLIVSVIDQVGPIIYLDKAIITVYNTTVLSLTDFTGLLIKTGEIPNQNYRVSIKYDSYSSHALKAGTYHLSLELNGEDGFVLSKDLVIIVKDKPSDLIGEIPVIDGLGSFPPITATIATIASSVALCAGFAANLLWWKKKRKK